MRTTSKPTRRDTLKLISAGAIAGGSRPDCGARARSPTTSGSRWSSKISATAISTLAPRAPRKPRPKQGGFEIIYTAPTKATAEEQIAVIDALIAQKVDGIIVSANDANALVPVAKKAMERGIKVISFDSAIAKDGRLMQLNASYTPLIGAKQVQMIAKTLGNKGEVAILSAASTMTNQNSWIAAMKEEWKKPEYKDMPLVATVYGDDQDDKSYREMQALAKAHPNLKGVISPTTIGIRAGAKAIIDDGLVGKIYITGLGLPSEMKDAVLKGACDSFAIWNPVDYGYASTEIMINILNGAPRARDRPSRWAAREKPRLARTAKPRWANPSSSTSRTSRNSRRSSDRSWLPPKEGGSRSSSHLGLHSSSSRKSRVQSMGRSVRPLSRLKSLGDIDAFPRTSDDAGLVTGGRLEILSRRARAARRHVRLARGRGHGAHRRERRRQIDPREDPHRHLHARRRRDALSTARARELRVAARMPGPPASPPSTRRR